ncbi:MAG: N-acetyl-gamma-glutamyl-phosphate reductase [Deltaproteobacteria bacterium]|jgi:N-acetyl-gamma-glutamyl-phosphate reductase|nr:N-acetyl-gamma-glutamyl-phosphate reductase [Deltaproteobacteria bacterium]
MNLGVIGANGYTGQALLSVLAGRPGDPVTLVTSRGDQGKRLAGLHPSLDGCPAYKDLILEHPDSLERVAKEEPGRFPGLFLLCVTHGASMALVPRLLALGARVIDLTGDFRLRDPALYPKWYGTRHPEPGLLGEAVYGLPELHREGIRGARLVANPGCYPTSAILALAPLAKAGILDPDKPVIADSKSGVSGAGRKAQVEYSYCELNDNLKSYKTVGHQHTPEIAQGLSHFLGRTPRVSFTPHLIPLSRGILTTCYAWLRPGASPEPVPGLYASFCENEPFLRFRGIGAGLSTLDVRGTNFCDLSVSLDPEAGLVKAVSVIDNLARGAVTQAVANLNIMLGEPEGLGIPMAAFRP